MAGIVQVNGAVGCLARIPLPDGMPLDDESVGDRRGAEEQPVVRAVRNLGALPRCGSQLWAPYLRDTALRVFASVGMSAQVLKGVIALRKCS